MPSKTVWQKLHDTALRGAFACVWIFAAMLGVFQFIYMTETDDPVEQNKFLIRCGICIAICLVGAMFHGILLGKKFLEEEQNDE